MSWFHVNINATDARNHATLAEVVACFQDEKSELNRLALLISGDEAIAQRSVVKACDGTLQGHSPFRDWLFEWAKSATIGEAISAMAQTIRACEATYRDHRCDHSEHLSIGDAEERAASLNLLFQVDPQKIIDELDPLCRAILVLRVASRSSIQDCVLRLNVCRAAVVAANCRALTWLHSLALKPAVREVTPAPPPLEYTHDFGPSTQA